MQAIEIQEIVRKQREFFQTGKTLSVSERKACLKKLKAIIHAREAEILTALQADLGKSSLESYMCEVGMALSEITYLLKRIKKWSKPKRARTPFAQFASKSYVQATPYGTTLVISPWNYPFLLAVEPVIDAIAAGNTAVVKPSAYSPHTSELLESLFADCFSVEQVAVVRGGRKENTALLGQKFDMIFFTGSQEVGKEVLRHAAENLTPTVLELGGKSPCIVDETAKIPLAAKRIVFGKFLNCGQTCVAPDYILCHASKKEELLRELKKQIVLQFGDNPLENPDYGKIVNGKHFARLRGLIDEEKVVFGGGMYEMKEKIAPTILDNVTWEDRVMQEEIFGPILPILTFESFEEIYGLLQDKPKPLALYLFTESENRKKEVVARIPFGGGCINDVIIHLATSEMGFGGVGESGMGAYHGKAGFDVFSHKKSIVDKKTWLDLPMRYQPYTAKKERTVRRFLK